MKCVAYLVADSVDIKAIPSELRLREVCFIRLKENHIVVFPYGVIVIWGNGNISEAMLLLKDHLRGELLAKKMLKDEFDLDFNPSHEAKLVFQDQINIKEPLELELVALSHPIAQSIRLMQFEDKLVESINKISHIPKSLASYGRIKESKSKISKIQGHLYLLKGKINFEHSVLDKPEFFWEYPEYDELYHRMADYLEISQRISVLDRKIKTIDEILTILSEELNHRHSSKLEIIIILLILIEIIIFFLQDVFKVIN